MQMLDCPGTASPQSGGAQQPWWSAPTPLTSSPPKTEPLPISDHIPLSLTKLQPRRPPPPQNRPWLPSRPYQRHGTGNRLCYRVTYTPYGTRPITKCLVRWGGHVGVTRVEWWCAPQQATSSTARLCHSFAARPCHSIACHAGQEAKPFAGGHLIAVYWYDGWGSDSRLLVKRPRGVRACPLHPPPPPHTPAPPQGP